jgi:hypothetical protein
MMYAQASGVPSEAVIVTSVQPDAAEAPPAQASAATTSASRTRT